MSNDRYQDKIYRLDELILDVYNEVYSKSGRFKTKFMDATDLKMDRFKASDYNLDTIFEKTVFDNYYPTGLMLKGKPVEQMWFKRKGETHVTTIRMVPYINKEAVDNMNDPVNVNQVIRTLLSELVVNDKTNNILLPIINVDVVGSDLVTYNKVFPKVNENTYYSVQITERFYKLTRLDKFLRDYPLEPRIIKSIIYQAVDVLYRINESYPTFRYNQLIPEMMDCYLKVKGDITYPEIKLGDFYLAEIRGIIENNYLKNTDINIPYIDSIYSDLYQLLNYLWNRLNTVIKESQELVEFFDHYLPGKIRSDNAYLTEELWNSLSNEEKFDLRIKNIKNSAYLAGKDILASTDFVENNNGELSGGRESENELTSIQFTENEDIERTVSRISDEQENSAGLTEANKKYYSNDIDDMSNKKSNRRNNRLERDLSNSESTRRSEKNLSNRNAEELTEVDVITGKESEYTEELTESTEKNTTRSRPSRIINVSESDVLRRAIHSKPKSYQGRRIIGENKNSQENARSNSFQYDNLQNNGVPSRINSIGNLFGITPNDFNNRGSPMGYEQIAQQMAQQFQQNGVSQYLPSALPSNTVSQIPLPIQNPAGGLTNPSMQQNNRTPEQEALYRYLAAANQTPQQQIDPNMMAMLMQQQPTQIGQTYPQMAVPTTTGQTGGARNPFFFQ